MEAYFKAQMESFRLSGLIFATCFLRFRRTQRKKPQDDTTARAEAIIMFIGFKLTHTVSFNRSSFIVCMLLPSGEH